jgi:uncharacterized iron-regulated membrane protein
MKRIKAATVRQVIVRLHRRVGLAVSAFLVLAGLTGSALTFREELEDGSPQNCMRPLQLGALALQHRWTRSC